MDFKQYSEYRNQLLEQNPAIMDGGETNLYRFLKDSHPDELPEIVPSAHKDAEYRCHVADVYLNFLGLSRRWKSQLLISHGVRHSLSIIFKIWASEGRVAYLPSDVYPMYEQLAHEAGLDCISFSQVEWMNKPYELVGQQEKAGVLLCDPIKPWCLGGVAVEQWKSLLNHKGVEVVLDSAYDIRATLNAEFLTQLRQDAPIVRLSSLSKGWLIPNHAGFVLGPSSIIDKWRPVFIKESIDKHKLRIAYQALTQDSSRYQVVKGLVSKHQKKGLQLLLSHRIPVTCSHHYFAIVPWSWKFLLDNTGILAVPPSVFGMEGFDDQCVVSLLGLFGR